MYIQDIIKRLNRTSVRIGNINYYPSFNVENELMKLEETCIQWSVDDFKSRAIDYKGDDWEEYYDKNKFKQALAEMIYRHDAENGITWDTIDYYLDYMCVNRTTAGMRMDIYNSKL